MKAIVKVFVPSAVGEPGSSNEYSVDDADPKHGELIAAAITKAVDTRPDPDGRLLELRRALVELKSIARRVAKKPNGGKTVVSRVQYHATSRTTGDKVRVELRHQSDTDVEPNKDDV